MDGELFDREGEIGGTMTVGAGWKGGGYYSVGEWGVQYLQFFVEEIGGVVVRVVAISIVGCRRLRQFVMVLK